MITLFMPHLTPAPLLESENFFSPSLVWLSDHVHVVRSRCVSGASCICVCCSPPLPQGHLAGLEWGAELFWEHRAVITPSLRHLGLPLKHLSSYYHHGFNFFNFASVAKLVVSAMRFSWADAQGVLPSQGSTWPSWLSPVWEAGQPLRNWRNIVW